MLPSVQKKICLAWLLSSITLKREFGLRIAKMVYQDQTAYPWSVV